MELQPLTFANGILPLAVLVAATIGLPALLAGGTLSQGRLGVAVLVTALLVWALGAGVLAVQYAMSEGGMVSGLWALLERSALMGLLWVPLLGVVWLMRAQGVERRRGLMMREAGE
jgi:predicted membrane-bound spermidine synthase